MSRFSKFSSKKLSRINELGETVVENFMGGNSYSLNPLLTLKIVASSSIFGEPQYYRKGEGSIKNAVTLEKYSIFHEFIKDKKTVVEVFTEAIDNSLDYDFEGTLNFAVELRTEHYMRLNPSVIFVRASIHEKRKEFNEKNPGKLKEIGKKIAMRPDDLSNQLDYYMFLKKTKKGLPSIVKRTWAEKLQEYSRYQLNKYKGKKIIDLVRVSHANNEDIDELMRKGSLKIEESEKTWETLRSNGKTWKEISETIKIPHMALLRNLRGIFTEIEDRDITRKFLSELKNGVANGKQFPFRYWSAYKAITNSEIHNKQSVLDTLEECIDISVSNMPKLKGKVACLSDNSGSAWGTFNSEYGTVTVAEISNLSSLITAQQAEEGFVGVFGDNLSMESVSKRNGLLSQLEKTCERGNLQGKATENGIWLFWEKAIREKEHWDTVFIYSDMQAGHGGLYGLNSYEYKDYIHEKGSLNIDVLSLVEKYRSTVNQKVNLFSVQVSGYNNTVLPENLYRGAILSGWTGKEPLYATTIIDLWDKIENFS